MPNQKPKSEFPASKAPDAAERKLESYLAAIPEGTEIDHYVRHAHTLELFVNWQEPGRNERLCPNCASTRCVRKDSGKTQTVRHVRCGEFGTLLTFHKPRFLCKDLRKCPLASLSSQSSRRLEFACGKCGAPVGNRST